MRTDRLLVLADYLDAVDPMRFDLREWITRTDGPEDAVTVLHRCGSVACAVGHACLIREFNEAGFRMGRHGSPVLTGYPVLRKYGISIDRIGWDAVLVFFGISHEIARYLFVRHAYDNPRPGPDDVAERIRDAVSRYLGIMYASGF